METDTTEDEDVVDLNALLLPGGILPVDVDRFSLSYSKALFGGWVKQDSPCCAAASVAGAWNGLMGRHRLDRGSFSSENVLSAMRIVLEEHIAAKRSRIEQRLGASTAPLVSALVTALAREGKYLGGRKEKAATSGKMLRLIHSITEYELGQEKGRAEIYDRLGELYDGEGLIRRGSKSSLRAPRVGSAVGGGIGRRGKGEEEEEEVLLQDMEEELVEVGKVANRKLAGRVGMERLHNEVGGGRGGGSEVRLRKDGCPKRLLGVTPGGEGEEESGVQVRGGTPSASAL
ncbi:unnamed protein product, partial [Choristocarpus tenellus]